MFAVSLIKLFDSNNSNKIGLQKAEYSEEINKRLTELKMLESQILEANARHDNTIFDSKENELISLQGIEPLYLKAEIKRKDLDLCAMEYQVNYGIEKQIPTLIELEHIKTKNKDRSEKAANNRHSENRSMKADTIKLYIETREAYKNKDDAADKLSGTFVNASFATVRGWLKNV